MSCIYWIYFKLWKEKEKIKDRAETKVENKQK